MFHDNSIIFPFKYQKSIQNTVIHQSNVTSVLFFSLSSKYNYITIFIIYFHSQNYRFSYYFSNIFLDTYINIKHKNIFLFFILTCIIFLQISIPLNYFIHYAGYFLFFCALNCTFNLCNQIF